MKPKSTDQEIRAEARALFTEHIERSLVHWKQCLNGKSKRAVPYTHQERVFARAYVERLVFVQACLKAVAKVKG
jgi:hypothetical protein